MKLWSWLLHSPLERRHSHSHRSGDLGDHGHTRRTTANAHATSPKHKGPQHATSRLHRMLDMSSSPPPQTPTLQRPPPDDDSDSESDSTQVPGPQRRSPLPPRGTRSPVPLSSDPTTNYTRPSGTPRGGDLPFRNEDHVLHIGATLGHRPRQRSQGYFEPTLPSNTASMAANQHLTTSQIAAQTAMHVQNPQHMRKRSTTIPEPGRDGGAGQRQPTSPPPLPSTVTFKTNGMTYQNGLVGPNRIAATTAANAAFPRSPLPSPGIPGSEHGSPKPSFSDWPLQKTKEKSKIKLFSKPKAIGITKDKDLDKKHPALPSPGKIGIHSSHALKNMMMNQSTTSLAESTLTGSTLYSGANGSTSTLVPLRGETPHEKEKEKHKHHFLSRQKNKLKDKDDHHLPLSSANSNSRPTDPNAPQPLYSFAAPSSPGHASGFAGSVTGLDLRHGGRHLRQKKKEEKAAAYLDASLDPPFRERNQSFSTDRVEWPSVAGSMASTPGGVLAPSQSASLNCNADTMANLAHTFSLPGLSADDAWPLLKARLLHIFEGEDIRPPIEDFNALVTVHIKRCVQKRNPTILIDDLNELLQTGFASLDQTLRHVPDDRLIPHLVEMWMVVFTTILPFLQAVFLPLDLEFKGRGIMSPSAAAEFWGARLPDSEPSSNSNIPTLGEELDVRRITLLTFRDTVILPRNDTLTAIFSRLSLENLNAGLESPNPLTDRPTTSGTSGSEGGGANAAKSSLNSQGSSAGYLESAASTSFNSSARSRATSNTSAGSFSALSTHSNSASLLAPHAPLPPSLRPQPMDSAKVTETVGRMLQCVSVLSSLQSGDEAQEKMMRLNKELKYNWLGRGRTGRQRRGFVGPRRGGVGMSGVVGGLGVQGVA